VEILASFRKNMAFTLRPTCGGEEDGGFCEAMPDQKRKRRPVEGLFDVRIDLLAMSLSLINLRLSRFDYIRPAALLIIGMVASLAWAALPVTGALPGRKDTVMLRTPVFVAVLFMVNGVGGYGELRGACG
jgi:hypothetical protein